MTKKKKKKKMFVIRLRLMRQEPHKYQETHEGRKVSAKYVILIIITLKKYVGYTILC